MSRPTQSIHPHVFVRYWTHSDQMESVHMSERSARSIERRGTHRCLAVQECVAVPIEQYQAIRALHEIVYALEANRGAGLSLTRQAMEALSGDARRLADARFAETLPDPLAPHPYSRAAAVAKATEMAQILQLDAPDQSAQNQEP